jgi:putative restriction endonuclease
MSLAEYQEKIKRLVVNKTAGRVSPHKLCMLLAVLDLAQAGALPENRILFEPPLLERYSRFFNAVKSPEDHANPYFPFFHLAGALRGGAPSFWHLRPLPGREAALRELESARSLKDITRNVAYVELDVELFHLLQNTGSIDALATTVATHWLDRSYDELLTVAGESRKSSIYERALRTESLVVAETLPPAYIRNPAFRRFVTEVYDYRCAATGIRIVLPSGEALVEAAHIHPFSEAGDDDPRNGLALTRDMHWAMDKHLIAPGPDMKWHVSPLLDDRVPDLRVLVSLEGRPLLGPKELRFAPRRDVLEWRIERLRAW